jgi:hypothetical protein
MTMRSWMVMAWPRVDHKVSAELLGLPGFKHMETALRQDPDESGRRVGESVWLSVQRGKRVTGVAWEWVEVAPGLVALSDLNSVVSNARWVSELGTEFDELTSVVVLNLVLHALPWQQQALDCLADFVRPPAPGRLSSGRASQVIRAADFRAAMPAHIASARFCGPPTLAAPGH